MRAPSTAVRLFCAFLALAALPGLLSIACGDPGGSAEEGAAGAPAPPSVTVYSGRGEALVGPLLERFGEQAGIEVSVRYGDTSELAAVLKEEGANSPADLFFSQDAAALGALSDAGLLTALPAELMARVPARFASPKGDWVGLSGRARSVVYNTERLRPEKLPQSLEEVAEPRFAGRFGLAPANASFQAHMAVYAAVEGQEALEQLLAGLVANEPRRFPNNRSIVEAVIAGEIDFGLVNHYYLLRALDESPGAPGANFFQSQGAASGYVNLAGAGLLRQTPQALALLELLLSEEAQRYFAEETFEYPLAAGVEPAAEVPPLAELSTPEVDFGRVADALPAALDAIADSGLLR